MIHREPLVKHHETLLKHCETLIIRCNDIGGDVGARCGDICDCVVGITPQMCNRVTNHGVVSKSTFKLLKPIEIYNLHHYEIVLVSLMNSN